MTTKNPKPRPANCATGCGRAAALPYSKHCRTCARKIQRYGSPFAAGCRKDTFKAYRPEIQAFCHRHRESEALKWAHQAAADVLNYRPSAEWHYMATLGDRMDILRAYGVTPAQLACRVAEFAMYEEVYPYESERRRDMELARAVLKLAPLRGYRPAGHACLLLAQLIMEDGLWRFALGLRMRIEADRQERAKRKAGLANWSPAV